MNNLLYNKMFWVVLALGLIIAIFAVNARATAVEKVALCHQTSSETNPWVYQEVNANEEQSHLDNGDVLYGGDSDASKEEKDAWCNQNNLTPTPTEEITPNPTEEPTDNRKNDPANCLNRDCSTHPVLPAAAPNTGF